MADYMRGWRDSSSRSPYFKKIERRKITAHPKSPKTKAGWRFSKNFFFTFFQKIFRSAFAGKGLWKKILLGVMALALLGFIVFGVLFIYYSFNLPDPNKLLDQRDIAQSTKIYDRNGKLLYDIHGEAKRTLVTLDQVPLTVREATIAIEDKNFYKHGGIDFFGIARSLLVDLLSGHLSQGGSTITQQFVRDALLSREKTITRKVKEVVLSLELERKYSKDQILQLYLNEIPYGSNAYGIEAASQTFFGKDAKDLDLAQSAYLAAMPQAPTYYSPFGPHRKDLIARADTVLQVMYEQGYITKDQKTAAQNEKVDFQGLGNGILAPHFVMYVEDLLAQKYGEIGLQEGGYQITTTLDYNLQQIAEAAIAKQVAINEKQWNGANASLVAINPKTGEILAMVGSRNYFDQTHDGAVNVALQPRQPGSSFKPYVYATAFKQGYNPATMLLDVITNFGQYGGKDYIPTDYDGKERGPVSIRQALQNSLNIPAVKTAILVGVDNAIDTAQAMGITTLTDRSRYGPSLVLGGGEVKLLEHASAYGVFAAGGVKHDTAAILKIVDKNGKVLEQFQPSEGQQVLNPQVAYQINNVLSDKQARSLLFTNINNKLTLSDRPVAAKTGTTQEFRDAWTVGYTPSLVAGVWVGNNDNTSMKKGADGLIVAAPIWNEFMHNALTGTPPENFSKPDGMIEMQVDALTGKLPTSYTPTTKTDVFTSFNAPTQYDDAHQPDGTTALHSERPLDPAWENPVRAWALAHGYSSSSVTDTGQTDSNINIQISAPATVGTLPFQITATASGPAQISTMQMSLDNNFVMSSNGNTLNYTGTVPHADGIHQLMIQARTANNHINQKTQSLTFALNQSAALINPTDDQQISLPTSIVLEATTNLTPENVLFFARTASGKEIALAGPISKQQSGQIFFYTLHWSGAGQTFSGSYALYGKINGIVSNAATVKIQ